VITRARLLRAASSLLLCGSLFAPAASGWAGLASPADNREAQPYALIFGTVWSADNRPVYGVTVRIRRADQKNSKWQLMSDHHGEFAQRLPAGKADYVVWADIKTKKGQEKPQVLVHIENDERKDIGLHLTE
jgi:hypothetical protein